MFSRDITTKSQKVQEIIFTPPPNFVKSSSVHENFHLYKPSICIPGQPRRVKSRELDMTRYLYGIIPAYVIKAFA